MNIWGSLFGAAGPYGDSLGDSLGGSFSDGFKQQEMQASQQAQMQQQANASGLGNLAGLANVAIGQAANGITDPETFIGGWSTGDYVINLIKPPKVEPPKSTVPDPEDVKGRKFRGEQ